MPNPTKKIIDRRLAAYCRGLEKTFRLKAVSPLLSARIKEFILRPGKRARPLLFALGYLGFAKKAAPGLYQSALSIELLHDFMLVHDDIIDKSDLRRGKPSMHAAFNSYLRRYPGIKFSGEDLSIVVGDILYAMAVHTFCAIKEEPARKEAALKKFAEAALYTGCGEFIELLDGAKPIEALSQKDIYAIYDLKTAYYTFGYPLSIGATLAGASPREIEAVFSLGVSLGRAFQIKDDILGIFGDERAIGKSTLTDLQESKKTILVWKAFRRADTRQKQLIKRIMAKPRVKRSDLARMRRVIEETGSLSYARNEVMRLCAVARQQISSCGMRRGSRQELLSYVRTILELE